MSAAPLAISKDASVMVAGSDGKLRTLRQRIPVHVPNRNPQRHSPSDFLAGPRSLVWCLHTSGL
jgi:hypothetical protein